MKDRSENEKKLWSLNGQMQVWSLVGLQTPHLCLECLLCDAPSSDTAEVPSTFRPT